MSGAAGGPGAGPDVGGAQVPGPEPERGDAAAADTIAAVATAAGRAGIGIVRVSGPGAPRIARAMTGRELVAREAAHGPFLDAAGEALDVGVALRFEAPRSFTGEHVLELQGHGGPVVLDRVLARALELGARPARPGEFSERAFLNGRMDLAQAEAVADLIDAASEGAARAAVRSMAGGLSEDVTRLVDELVALRVWLEAALDFAEEEIDFLADDALARRAEALAAAFETTLARAGQGRVLRDGLTVAIAGRPNVGKSSLLNALARAEAAIVTDVAGTTRDVLREDVTVDGVPVRVVDTAGLRETDDPVERIGVARAREALAAADHALLVVDASAPALPDGALPGAVPVTLVVNKIDLVDEGVEGDGGDRGDVVADRVVATLGIDPGTPRLALSATDGRGLDALRAHLAALAGRDASVEGVYLARRRHVEALARARDATRAALGRLRGGDWPELAAEEPRDAQRALEGITGRFDADDLPGDIFGAFCIGK